MKQARNQFVLLGILCQSLTWDGWSVPLLYLAVWWTALKAARDHRRAIPALEALMLVAGSAFGVALGKLPGQTSHFFIGHGITWLQLIRLLRPLDRREQTFSVIAACVQLGVGCTVILDFRFLFVLVGALILLPRTLQEMHAAEFGAAPAAPLPSLGWKPFAAVTAIMVAVFIGLPRAAVGSPLQSRRNPDTNEGSMVDSILDPTRSSLAQSGRTILQIEGRNLGPLRSFALVDFDGVRWLPDTRASLRRIRMVATNDLPPLERRRLRVKEVNFLGRVLPTEGPLRRLEGRFFRNPLQSFHATVECEAMWNTANNVYEYWLDPSPRIERLPPGLAGRLSQHPPISPKLEAWMQERTRGATNRLQEARQLEAYLRDTFTYELGAPVLKRLNALEEFLFEERRGHCERYASALALLLRMREIPSRVIIGYLPNNQSLFSGWRNIRFKDAHAWTEAWFSDLGWVSFDATPRSRTASTGLEFRDLVDALDLAWFMNVVSFDGMAQRDLLARGLRAAENAGAWTATHQRPILGGFVLILGLLAVVVWKPRWRRSSPVSATEQQALRMANHYGAMLRLLSVRGWHRTPQQTPSEFQLWLEQQDPDVGALTKPITHHFCKLRYGGELPSPDAETAMQTALKTLKRHPSGS